MPPHHSSSRLSIAMVVLHTSPFAAPGSGDVGGMNVLVRATAERLAVAGHRIEVVTRRTDPDAPPVRTLSSGVVLRLVDAGPAELRPKAEHEAFIAAFRGGLNALDRVDLVHSHHWLAGMAGLPFAHASGVPHVQSFHSIAADPATSLSAGERPESAGRLPGETHLARESDAVIAVSNAERNTAIERLGASPQRVRVVPPGVDRGLFRPGERVLRPRPYVVAAARLEPLKGVDLAIRAIADLPATTQPDLLVAGGATSGHDAYPDELRALAASLGVTDRVRFIGSTCRAELASLFAGASAVLMPSHSETYGLVALEAAACGAPVIASAAGGLIEAVAPGGGILIESRDPGEWAAAIAALLEDAPGWALRSVASQRFAAPRDWVESAAGTEAVYRELLEVRG